MGLIELGTVKATSRYPVKSLQGEGLAKAILRWPGIDGDRQYAFLRTENRSRFPWLTGRELPELITWSARYREPDAPRTSPVLVAAGDREHHVGDPELLERLSRAAGEKIQLLQVGRGTFDSMPVSVLSTATLPLVESRWGRPLDPRRFRANILVEPVDGRVPRETEWIGGTLVFGEGAQPAKLRMNAPIDRCVMITIDPDTGERDPALLRHVVQDFDNAVGVRGATEASGAIVVGDRVRLICSVT